MADDDPYADIATPIAASKPAAPSLRVPLRNPRIPGNAPDPYADIATPIATPAPATPTPQPSTWDVLTQPTEKTDKEYTQYKGLPGVAGATIKGLNDVARETGNAVEGVGTLLAHPIKSAEALGSAIKGAPAAIAQVPAAVKDINASADPLGHYAEAAQDTAAQGAGQALTSLGMEGLPAPKGQASAAIPKALTVAGTELPETVGQAASRANPAGIGTDLKGVEDVARRIPGSEGLRSVSTAQQGAAREVLANKAAEATGATTSTAPEAIEQNATNAAGAAKAAGSAKYDAIGKAAANADFSPAVQAAHDILQDESTIKVMPKAARDALGKVGSSLAEREEVSQAIYGREFSDLRPEQQVEVGKAMQGGAQSTSPLADALKARSELGSAANAAKDPADARLLHLAHEQLGEAINNALDAADKANGTSHVADLAEADKLWSQKYAFENFRDKLQQMMRDQPHTGNREISGSDFQKIVNDLDPRGATGKTQLQRMFPDDPQSVKDLHELADFMGRTQGGAGGMASGFAKLRILGLKESALGLITNVAGFSYILSRPGLARAILTALQGGKDVGRVAAAIGQINHAANLSQQNQPAKSSVVPPGRPAVSTPKGIYHFPNQKAADAFKFDAGIQ